MSLKLVAIAPLLVGCPGGNGSECGPTSGVVTNVVDDPVYLQLPFMTALHFKKEADLAKWDPSPCDARF